MPALDTTTPPRRHLPGVRPALAAACAALAWAGAAQGQCASTAAPGARVLVERFTSADCPHCWSQPTLAPGASALVIDWIVPGTQGDEAPLAAAALREAQERLGALGRATPQASDVHVQDLAPVPWAQLQVAQGPPVANYLGTSIRFRPPASARGRYWLDVMLVEAIPAGQEGSPVERHVVRNAYQSFWDIGRPPAPGKPRDWLEIRPLGIPENAQAERLRVLAWVRDGAGHLQAVAQTRCD